MKANIAFWTAFFFLPAMALCQTEHTNHSKPVAPLESNTPPPFSIIQVKSETVNSQQQIVGGTVVAAKSVVLSAQIAGRVISIAGEEGDSFKAGSLLVKINDDELLAQRHTAIIQLSNAHNLAHNANIQLHRQLISPSTSNKAPGGMGLPGMFDQIFTNPMSEMLGTRDYGMERFADINATRSQLDQAYYAVQQAESRIRQIDSKLRDTQSIAPFNGTIVKKAVEIGDTVQAGQSLLIFEDLKQLEIIVDVPNRLLQHLVLGQNVNVKIDGIAELLTAQIIKIFPTADPNRHTTRVKFHTEHLSSVSPGRYVEVQIPVSSSPHTPRLTVPSSAVVERGGLPAVLVVNEENQVELRLVRLGDALPSGEVVILFGVNEQQKILDNPPAYITSGYKIQ